MAENEHRRAMEYDEDDEPEPEEIHLREAEVKIPQIPVPHGSDGSVCPHTIFGNSSGLIIAQNWVFRLPNFMKLDTRPFDPVHYAGPENEEEAEQNGSINRERSMSIKLQVENTIRWRWVLDPTTGNYVRGLRLLTF